MRSIDEVLYMVESTLCRLTKRADGQGDGAMGVDMIGAVLSVVLNHEDCHLAPEPALGDALDDSAQRQVVVGNGRQYGRRAGLGARGVIVGQAHNDEPAASRLASRSPRARGGSGRRA